MTCSEGVLNEKWEMRGSTLWGRAIWGCRALPETRPHAGEWVTEQSQALGCGFPSRTHGGGGSVSVLSAAHTASPPKVRGGCGHVLCAAETPEPPGDSCGVAAWLT